jgi:methylaspartate ammonia-lyase
MIAMKSELYLVPHFTQVLDEVLKSVLISRDVAANMKSAKLVQIENIHTESV